MLGLYVLRIFPFGMFTLKVPSSAVSLVACVRRTCTRLSLRIVHHFLECREAVALVYIQDRAPVGIIRFARNACNIAVYPENPLFFLKKRRVEALNSINVSGL